MTTTLDLRTQDGGTAGTVMLTTSYSASNRTCLSSIKLLQHNSQLEEVVVRTRKRVQKFVAAGPNPFAKRELVEPGRDQFVPHNSLVAALSTDPSHVASE